MTTTYTQPRDADVKRLHDLGKSYGEMEKELHLPRGTICNSINRLIEAGEIVPRKLTGRRGAPGFGAALKLQALGFTSHRLRSPGKDARRTA